MTDANDVVVRSLGGLAIWQLESGRPLVSCTLPAVPGDRTLRCNPEGAVGLALVDLAFRPGVGWVGLELGSGEYRAWRLERTDGDDRAWRLEPRTELYRWKTSGRYRLSQDGSFAISDKGPFSVIDLIERRALLPVETDRMRIDGVLRAPEGPLLAVRSGGCTVRLVGLESGKSRAEFTQCGRVLGFSHDGRIALIGGFHEVGVLNLLPRQWMARRSDLSTANAAAMSPDQRYIVISAPSGSRDRITVWRWRWDDVRQEVCRVPSVDT